MEQGFRSILATVRGPEVYVHGEFARVEAEATVARAGIDQVFSRLAEPARRAQIAEAEQAYADDPTEENWARLEQSMTQSHHRGRGEDEQATESDRRYAGGEGKSVPT